MGWIFPPSGSPALLIYITQKPLLCESKHSKLSRNTGGFA